MFLSNRSLSSGLLCFVAGAQGNSDPGALPFPVCKCRSQDEGARRLGKCIGVGSECEAFSGMKEKESNFEQGVT